MKILLPTAKELNLKIRGQEPTDLRQESQEIIQALAQLSSIELAKHYKLKPEAAEREAERWQSLLRQDGLAYPAWLLFDGLMYRQMKRHQLTDVQEAYLRQHVFITSALYGVINVFEPISPHRLDFLMGFQVNDASLKAHWRKSFDQAVQGEDLILSLLSSEFETVFSKSIQDRMVRLKFAEEKEGQLKTHSTISKKGRGQCLNALVEAEVRDLESLKHLCFDGFEYREALSTDQELSFVRTL